MFSLSVWECKMLVEHAGEVRSVLHIQFRAQKKCVVEKQRCGERSTEVITKAARIKEPAQRGCRE